MLSRAVVSDRKSPKALWPVLASLSLLLAVGCNSWTGADDITFLDCVPGEVRACSCTAQTRGTQTCRPEGDGYGACQCSLRTGVSSLGAAGGTASVGSARPEMSFDQDGEQLEEADQALPRQRGSAE